MIIQIIDLNDVSVLESKRHPAVARNRDRKSTRQIALEPVQPKSGQIDSVRPTTPIQRGQNSHQLCNVARRNLGRVAAHVKRLQATMTERFDHRSIVQCQSTVVNYSQGPVLGSGHIAAINRAAVKYGDSIKKRGQFTIYLWNPGASAGGRSREIVNCPRFPCRAKKRSPLMSRYSRGPACMPRRLD